ncbi:MAG: oligosaccharide flippase family protein [Nitrososphaera sp.]|nr:oligosaccharide flippase family protein [Nitrososphaera sp.]
MKGSTSILEGALWITGVQVFAKSGGYIAQFVLGWMLVPEEFALYAVAMSVSAITLGFRNGGTEQLLVQRAQDFSELAEKILSFSLLFNLLTAGVIAATSIPASVFYAEPGLITLMPAIAVSVLTGTWTPVVRAKLSIDRAFRDQATYEFSALCFKHLLTIALALMGFGVFALAFALIFQPLLYTGHCYWRSRYWPRFGRLSWRDVVAIFSSSRWLILSNFATQLIVNGQILILGIYLDKVSLGYYYFALQLLMSPITLLSATTLGAIFPGLSFLQNDWKRFSDAANLCLIIGICIGAVMSMVVYCVSAPIITFLWGGKWDHAIPLIEILAFSIPSYIVIDVCYQLLSSKGYWRGRFLIVFGGAMMEMMVLAMVASTSSVTTIAVVFVLAKSLWSVMALMFCCWKARLFDSRNLDDVLKIYTSHGLLTCYIGLIVLLPLENNSRWVMLVAVVLCACYVVTAWMWIPKDLKLRLFEARKRIFR